MIITVTMNPAIDRTLEIDSLVRGGLNRIGRVEYDAGGKGINVSRTIRELGGKTIATGFLGGNSGRIIADILKAEGIESDFVQVNGETRTNIKVCEKNGVLTELNEPGPLITEKQVEELKDKLLRYAGTGTLFVLSGSIPAGVPEDTYAKIIRMIHEKGAEVLLDADSNAFRLGLEALPDIIKPNCAELEEYAGMTGGLSEEGIIKTAEEFRKKGIGTVAVSMGQSGALFLLGEKRARCPALPVKVSSTVGAGDAMVAGLALARDLQLAEEETIRLCMAVSAGAVTTSGTKPPPKELVEKLKKQVMILCSDL